MLPNLQFAVNLVTFTEEMLNGKLHFCAVNVLNKHTGLKTKTLRYNGKTSMIKELREEIINTPKLKNLSNNNRRH